MGVCGKSIEHINQCESSRYLELTRSPLLFAQMQGLEAGITAIVQRC